MAAPIKKEVADRLIYLRKQGLSYTEIAKQTGLSVSAVARKCRLYEGADLSARSESRKKLKALVDQLAEDRKTMLRKDVAKKHGLSESYINKILEGHPDRFLFFNSRYNKPEDNQLIYNNVLLDRVNMTIGEVAKKYNRDKTWVRFAVKKANIKVDSPLKEDVIGRKVKQQPKHKVLPKKKKVDTKPLPEKPEPIVIKDKGPTRRVRVNSKTELNVLLTDKRSDEQIINDYNRKYNKT